MVLDPNSKGVEAWEFSTPSVQEEGGERIPFDERSTLEIQMEIERIRGRDRGDGWRWIALLTLVVVAVALLPGTGAGLGLGLLGGALGGAGLAVASTRRRQLRDALESELDARRLEESVRAEDSALRLASLHDRLDRMAERPSRWGAVGLGALGTLVFAWVGLAESLQLVVTLAGFFGLATLLAAREQRREREQQRALEDQIRSIEERGHAPPDPE